MNVSDLERLLAAGDIGTVVVLMKPEHLDWLDHIWEILDRIT